MIDFEVEIINATEIDRVEFYLDDILQVGDTEAPFSWRWDTLSFGSHIVKVIGYHEGNSASCDVRIWKLF